MSSPDASNFSERCPFPKETSSGRPGPCPISSTEPTAHCLFEGYCQEEWNRSKKRGKTRLDQVFESSYHAAVAVTLAEPSASFVIRSEHHFHGKELFRMSLRRHLYEVLRPRREGDNWTFPADNKCHVLTEDTRLGLYIGYVDLRRHYESSPLAVGLLGVPRKLSVDPDAHVIVGNYSPTFGGPPLACTVYSMQDDETAGAACAQACIIMVLGMLSDRGGELEGSYTLTKLGYSADLKIPADVAAGFPKTIGQQVHDDPEVARIFPASGGLVPHRIVRVLKHLGVNAEATLLPAPPPGPKHDAERRAVEKLASRMIECYVQARYPVILGVDVIEWSKPKTPDVSPGKDRRGHAVSVVGLRKASVQNRQEHLIVHDPAKQPYVERSTAFCFRACWALRESDPVLAMIMPTEATVRRSLYSCWLSLRVTNLGLINLVVRGKSPLYPKVRFDYQFALAYRKDVHTFLWPVPLGSDARRNLDGQLGLRDTRYWCIAGYQSGQLMAAWFFSAETDASAGWELQLFRNVGGAFRLRRGDGDEVPLTLPPALDILFGP